MSGVTLVRYEAARSALAEARAVDEVKDIRDVAMALSFYAKQAKDRELIEAATDLRLRAERRLGEMIAAQKKTIGLATGTRGHGRPSLGGAEREPPKNDVPTRAEAGIDKKLSARAQHLATLPDDQFATRLSAAKREAVAHIEMPFAARAAEKKRMRAEREVELGANILAMPSKRFGVILADPPWRFKTFFESGLTNSSADNHYPTLSLEQIEALEVASIAADDCVLFLWGTVPMLLQTLDVMTSWDFAYKSHFCWIKERSGNGYWNRNKHELLLIGTRGSVPCPSARYAVRFRVRGEARSSQRKTRRRVRDDRGDVSYPAKDRAFRTRGAARLELLGQRGAVRRGRAVRGDSERHGARFRRGSA
jgi:N6-adenosine-specific RNA methylase IME4